MLFFFFPKRWKISQNNSDFRCTFSYTPAIFCGITHQKTLLCFNNFYLHFLSPSCVLHTTEFYRHGLNVIRSNMKKWGGCSWIWWKFHCNQIITHFIYHLQCLFIINMTVTSLSHGSTALIVFIKQIHPRAAFLLQTIWCWIVRSGQGCVGQPQWISISCERELPPGANCYTPDQLKVGCTSSQSISTSELSWNTEVCMRWWS